MADADIPATRRSLVDALAREEDVEPDYAPAGALALRDMNVIRYLSNAGDIRAIQCGPVHTGWAWNHISRSDEEWVKLALAEPAPRTHVPIPVIRLSAPEAHGVVIGPKASTMSAPSSTKMALLD